MKARICRENSDLDVIALMVVAAFAEQAVVDNIVNVELIKEWVAVL